MNPYHDRLGRFTFASMAAGAQIRRTLRHVRSAPDDALLDVFERITLRARRGKRDHEQLALLDAELQRRVAGGEPDPTPEQRRVDELVAGGAPWEEAYQEAYGGGGQGAGVDRRKGETVDQARRRAHRELTYVQYLQAEQETRGHLLNRAGRAENIDARTLFHGSHTRAMRYASDELVEYWRRHPRRSYSEYLAETTNDTAAAKSTRARRLQASNGKDR